MNYLVCNLTGLRTLKNSARDKLQALAQQECWNQQWMPKADWQGHPTHMMWRKGGKVFCKTCWGICAER